MRQINKHIIHCSDSLYGDAQAIKRYHINKGWKDIGYHYVIKQDGTIEIGRPLEKIGSHCKGHNKTSVGTCLIGRTIFTEKQFASLKQLHKSLEQTLSQKLPAYGHNKFNKDKTCPNFDVTKVLG